jgi:hypothetical protein
MRLLEQFAQCDMIVDLAIHRKRPSCFRVEKGLSAVFDVDNRQALVREYGPLVGIETAPVRPSMSNGFGQFERAVTRRSGRVSKLENSDEAAQLDSPPLVAGMWRQHCRVRVPADRVRPYAQF